MCYRLMALLAPSGRHIYHSLWCWISLQSKDQALSYLKYFGIYSVKVKWKAFYFAVFAKISAYLWWLDRGLHNKNNSVSVKISLFWAVSILLEGVNEVSFHIHELLNFWLSLGFTRKACHIRVQHGHWQWLITEDLVTAIRALRHDMIKRALLV